MVFGKVLEIAQIVTMSKLGKKEGGKLGLRLGASAHCRVMLCSQISDFDS